MGLQLSREKLTQQKHRDVVNEMYQNAIMEKIKQETSMLPYNWLLDRMKLAASTKGALQKDIEFLADRGKSPEFINNYLNSKMGDIGKYDAYVRNQEANGLPIKPFGKWLTDLKKSGAMTIQQSVAKAVGTHEGLSDSDLLGEKGYSSARKDAVKELASNIDYMTSTPGSDEQKKILAEKTKEVYEANLRAQFGKENVKAGERNGIPGWAIKKRDGTVVWRSEP